VVGGAVGGEVTCGNVGRGSSVGGSVGWGTSVCSDAVIATGAVVVGAVLGAMVVDTESDVIRGIVSSGLASRESAHEATAVATVATTATRVRRVDRSAMR
jgi:hypothetical protein